MAADLQIGVSEGRMSILFLGTRQQSRLKGMTGGGDHVTSCIMLYAERNYPGPCRYIQCRLPEDILFVGKRAADINNWFDWY